MKSQIDSDIRIVVKHDDALAIKADVLALKYADELSGVDHAVVQALAERLPDLRLRLPKPSSFYVTTTNGAIGASRVLFVGVGSRFQFRYGEIRTFARKVLEALAGEEAPHITHVAVTVHGPDYGLDESEAFESEIAGLFDAIGSGNFPVGLKQVTIVEINANRARRLTERLDKLLADRPQIGSLPKVTRALIDVPDRLRSVGYDSQNKPHIFVAMPFADEMDDIFHYGIQNAVNAAGFLCERTDLSSFTGDVVEWVKSRIVNASLVIADLSDANPNVYLEVGYAWGCGKPTVLLVKETSQLKFDVRGQRCLVYNRIRDLESALRTELAKLKMLSILR